MKLSAMILSLGLVLGTLAGCSDDDNGGNAPTPTPSATLSPDEAVDGLLTTVCEKLFACRSEFPFGDEAFEQFIGNTVKDCKTALVDQLGISDVAESVEAGRVVYDEALGAACVDEVETELGATTCAELWSTQDPTSLIADTSCESMLAGQVALGDACSNNFECVAGAQCAGGTCAPAN